MPHIENLYNFTCVHFIYICIIKLSIITSCCLSMMKYEYTSPESKISRRKFQRVNAVSHTGNVSRCITLAQRAKGEINYLNCYRFGRQHMVISIPLSWQCQKSLCQML